MNSEKWEYDYLAGEGDKISTHDISDALKQAEFF